MREGTPLGREAKAAMERGDLVPDGVILGIMKETLAQPAYRNGVILDGVPVEKVGQQIFEAILATASGKVTKSEIHGVGEEEFAPWQIGPTL